jgi:hypothetical protein
MPYRTYEQQIQWGEKTLAEFEEKVALLSIALSQWSGLGEHPDPELAKRVDNLRDQLLENLRH